ncbi:MAG: ATP-binding protein [Magnetospirillum sp.]|nr:ATP-binding protein [Magnetospirillum sp.]
MTVRLIAPSSVEICSIASTYGWQLGEDKSAHGDVRIVASTRFDLEKLQQALSAPFSGGIESEDFPERGLGQKFLRHLASGGQALSLRTDTAFALNIAALFADALRARLGLSSETHEALSTATHEAVANAVIHGNLAIASPLAGTKDAFLDYCQSCDQRLADPLFAARRIEISALRNGPTLELAVCDQGDGFNPAMAVRQRSKAGGHGLPLIAAMTERWHIEDGGRCTVMAFRC